ncbi:Hypothetical predicted protein [Mytilus galloprovincialis]|nr:Hypothetical predicted protein [Mytilus galloprovincialis]
METFVLQLQNELKTVNQKIKDIESGNRASQSVVITGLKNETTELRETSVMLLNSYDSLKKKFDTLQNENRVLEHDNTVLKSQIANWKNFSVQINQDLNSFTHSIAASNIQNVTTIQSGLDALTSQVKSLNFHFASLSSTSTSRSQDVLALINKTSSVDLKLKTIEQNYALQGNSMENRVHSLEQNYSSLASEHGTLKGMVNEMNQPVALTSCGSTGTYAIGQIMQFPNTKTSVGFNHVAEFFKTGKFTCEKSGVYLFSVHIAHYGPADSSFELQRNGEMISRVMIVSGTHSSAYYSGSGTVVVQINAGDTLFAMANRNVNNAASYSCFTVIRIN